MFLPVLTSKDRKSTIIIRQYHVVTNCLCFLHFQTNEEYNIYNGKALVICILYILVARRFQFVAEIPNWGCISTLGQCHNRQHS